MSRKYFCPKEINTELQLLNSFRGVVTIKGGGQFYVSLLYLMRHEHGEQLALLLTTAEIGKTTAVGSPPGFNPCWAKAIPEETIGRAHTGKQRHKQTCKYVYTHIKEEEKTLKGRMRPCFLQAVYSPGYSGNHSSCVLSKR